jgi:hypothetical protein
VLTGYHDGGTAVYGATMGSPTLNQYQQRPDTAQSYNSIFANLDVEADAVNPMRPTTAGSHNYVSDDEGTLNIHIRVRCLYFGSFFFFLPCVLSVEQELIG